MPVLLERKRPSERQLKAVRAYIMRRRQRERQALAESKAKQEAAMQRKREQEKKKETVEDVKIEISKLESKLESLKNEKHELFLQLKKVLNEESEQKRQKERQLPPAFHQPMIANSVHRMPYGMMGPRPYGIMGNVAATSTQPVRLEVAPGQGGAKQPVSPLHSQGYSYLTPSNQHSSPAPPFPNPSAGYMASNDKPYGGMSSNAQPEKHFKITGNQPVAGSSTAAATPLHVVTSYTPPASTHQSPHNQTILQQGDKLQPSMKLHSPKPAALPSVPHGYPTHHQGDPGLHQGRPLVNQPVTHQQTSKHQFSHPQHQQITSSSNTYPKHDTTHQFKHSSQPQNKQPMYTSYPPKPELPQQPMHHKVTNKPLQTHPKIDQIPQHKQLPQQSYQPQTETVKQEHVQSVRPQQYGIHNYQQHQGVTSSSQAYPSSSHHVKQTSQPSTYPTKPPQEPEPKQSFQMPSAQQQQTYGYSMQQQTTSSYTDHQQYLNKSQTPNQAAAQVSYPTAAQQQGYPGFNKELSTVSQYSQQHHGYPVTQQVYSGQQQYQGFLSQQYQAQPYHGYPAQAEHKGQQQPTPQNYQGLLQSSPSQKNPSRTSQFEPGKHDQEMPPPPPQKPPPTKQDQEHYHQTIKRPSHRYGHPYKREHSSSSKSKFSEKYSSSQDDQPGSSSSRHHYHPSSKSSHSKGPSSSSSRQSRYH